jgi:hypothetical protein
MSVRGQRSGEGFRKRFYEDEAYAAAILRRLIIGQMKWRARVAGHPPPIFYDYELEPMPGGGYRAKEGSFRQLSEEELK